METPTYRDRESIQAAQLEALQRLLGEMPSNRFYARRLTDADLDASITSLNAFTERMPFTHKHELCEDQVNHPPFGSNLTYPIERYTRFHQTSGSTGTPIRWLDTPESWSWMVNNWQRVFEEAGVTQVDRVFFAFSFGPFLGFWTAFEAAAQLGALCVPGGGMSTEARLEQIMTSDITILCCTPTYAIRLAEDAEKHRIDLAESSVRRIVVAGEPGGSVPATREYIKRLWRGATVFDHHGMTEIGPVSFEDPNEPGTLRIIEPAYLTEVIEPSTGQAVAPGETGELVLTTLGRVACPLLRYRTGDLVKLGEPNHNGRPETALPGGILGRTDDMVIVRGVNIFPSAMEAIIRAAGGPAVAEYRVEVKTERAMAELNVLIEPSDECRSVEGMIEGISQAMRSMFNLRIPVTTVEQGTLPRFEMKAKRWIRI